MRRRGFTLVELLVVLGVIVLLMGILVPTLKSARESARAVKCANNMRQIYAAVIAYANDNEGTLPGAPDTTPFANATIKYNAYYYVQGKPDTIEFQHGAIMKYLG